MDPADREEIDRIKKDLDESKVDPVTKIGALRALTLSANAANGSQDRTLDMAKAQHALAVCLVRFVVAAPTYAAEAAEAAANAAIKKCPMRGRHAKADGVEAMEKASWWAVLKLATLKAPYAAALVVAVYVFKGLGMQILTFVSGG